MHQILLVTRRVFGIALAAAACSGASSNAESRGAGAAPASDGRLFTRLPSSYTGVAFANRVVDTPELNVFTYRNFYQGGGVAIGDLSGDSLPELVFTANLDGPAVYLNEGAFRFRDITAESGLKHRRSGWTTGVSLADVNGDGRLDIYVSRAGNGPPSSRANQLWINEGAGDGGIPSFVERAREFGLADEGYGTTAAFLDYDRDGDLDAYVLNNSPAPVGGFGVRNTRDIRDRFGGHKLLRNDGGRFVDVSAAAGIYGSVIGFGLGLGVSDIDRDGWPDIYVANDFHERDYLYMNRGDGSFAERIVEATTSISHFSMGMDVADVDNDGLPDVYTTDMLPEDEYRLRTIASFEGWDAYQLKVRDGFHHQFMRNMLQRNNGDGTFSEIGRMAGVSRTDWSWSALIADLDLDGRKDIYVTNGLVKDVTSRDYIAFLSNAETMLEAKRGGRVDYMKLIDAMPSARLADFAFRNRGDLRFENDAVAWGLETPNISSGAAYGDLDGDGALDLVVNNVNDEAFVYRNNARRVRPQNRFVQIELEGAGKNRFGVGARATLWSGDEQLFLEQSPSRGFESSVDYVLTFGVGPREMLDSLVVEWPDGRAQVMTRVASNRRITVRQSEAAQPVRPRGAPVASSAVAALLADVTDVAALPFVHRENAFVDFERDPLTPKLLSTEGPPLAVADVNGDGLDDVYIGGAKDQAGRLLIQQRSGAFVASNPGLFELDQVSEDVGAIFFDADGDRRPDLYVVSGGSEYSDLSPALQDRLYLNDGGGKFRRSSDRLPTETASGSRAAAADFDADGDLDLFVGGRVVPWQYGVSPRSLLLRNDGRGHFTDATDLLAPGLARVGMVTDATWQDVDGDGRVDLVVVGEWMPVTIFRNAGRGHLERANSAGLEKSDGWWNRIVAGDFTGDGRIDFVVGNLGLNSRLAASDAEPVSMYVKDFDGNGFTEQILTTQSQGRSYPIVLRDDLLEALPTLGARYPNHSAYARQSVTDIFSSSDLAGAVVRTAHTFSTSLVRNDGDGSFTVIPLPDEAQRAPVYGMLARDVDGDGNQDLLLAGNFDGFEPQLGRMSASYGQLLRGDGKGGFTPLPARRSGFFVPGQSRDIQRLRGANGEMFIVARNNDRPLVFRSAQRN